MKQSRRETEFVNPKCVSAAIATYNQVRAALQDGGWYRAEPSIHDHSAYWWGHDKHLGKFSMPAAFRQLVVDEIKGKAENPVAP